NPSAGNSNATATTSFSNWGPNGFKLQLDLNTGTPQWSFGYKSPDADISNPENAHLTSLNLPTYIVPQSSSNLFFFDPGTVASNWGMLLVNANGLESSVNGSTETPLPAALPLFASGAGVLGWFGWRRKKKTAALPA